MTVEQKICMSCGADVYVRIECGTIAGVRQMNCDTCTVGIAHEYFRRAAATGDMEYKKTAVELLRRVIQQGRVQ